MKFEKKALKDNQVQLTVDFDQETFDKYKNSAARKISSKSKVPGFRPGKAPLDIVKRIYGDDYVDEEALELLVHDKYPELLNEADIQPAAAGKLEKVEKLNPPKLVFVVPLEPVIELGDYKSIRMKYELPEITDMDINEVIHNLQLNYATAETTDREAKKGDLVNFKLTADIINPDEDQSSDLLKDSPYQMVIGEKQREEFPYEGFDKELIGLKENDTKELSYKYPKNASLEKLQGKEVKFNIAVTGVKALKLPEVTDDFAKDVSGLDSLETLKTSIKNQLAYNKNADYEEKYYNALIDEIIKKSKIAFPPVLLDDEIQQVLHEFEHNLAHQNMDMETFLKLNKMEEADFIEKEIKPVAQRQLEHSLVLEQLSKAENIELQTEDLERVYRQTMYEYQTRDDFNKIKRELSPKKLANSVLMQAASRLMNRQVLDRIKQIANGEEITKPEEQEEEKVEKTPKQVKADSPKAAKKMAVKEPYVKREEVKNE
ncbi:MAG: trigger factor [Chloroflexi bacterium]|nr:trigger factor [Chloroflexota bacterium]